MWEALQDTYEAIPSQTGTMALLQSFANLHSHETDSSINDYIVYLLDVRDLLTETVDPITDCMVMAHLLNTLPPSFGMIQWIINYNPCQDLTMEYIIGTLVE